MGWNVVCHSGYVAEEAVAAAIDGLGDGRETSGRGDLHIPDELDDTQGRINRFVGQGTG